MQLPCQVAGEHRLKILTQRPLTAFGRFRQRFAALAAMRCHFVRLPGRELGGWHGNCTNFDMMRAAAPAISGATAPNTDFHLFMSKTRSNLMQRHTPGMANFLTRVSIRRTVPALAILLSATGLSVHAAEQRWHSLQDITRTAEAFVRGRNDIGDDRIQPTVGHLDPRLKLAPCKGALEAFAGPGKQNSGRMIVGVRCTTGTQWKVYVPVQVAYLQSVVTLTRSLPAGHRIAAGDIALLSTDVARLTGGYRRSAESVIGQRLRRAANAGSIVSDDLLQAETLILRGQSVMLVTDGDVLQVRVSGTALSDGALHERVRVKNVSSGRIVEGVVRSSEIVEVQSR